MSASHRRATRTVVPITPPAAPPAVAPVAAPARRRRHTLAGLPSRLVGWLLARIDPYDPAALDAARRQPPVQPGPRQTEPWRTPLAPGTHDRRFD